MAYDRKRASNRNRKRTGYNTINNLSDEEYQRLFSPEVIAQRTEEVRAQWTPSEEARRIVEPSPPVELPEGYSTYEGRLDRIRGGKGD